MATFCCNLCSHKNVVPIHPTVITVTKYHTQSPSNLLPILHPISSFNMMGTGTKITANLSTCLPRSHYSNLININYFCIIILTSLSHHTCSSFFSSVPFLKASQSMSLLESFAALISFSSASVASSSSSAVAACPSA